MTESIEPITACACMGPEGDCPCVRKQKGIPLDISKSYTSEVCLKFLDREERFMYDELMAKDWETLPNDDKETFNGLGMEAFLRWHMGNV